MNDFNLRGVAGFVVLVLLQVVVFNNINLFGYVNPYVYLFFILIYPFNKNRTLFIVVAFLLGLTVDMFMDSGGINAIACLVIAYIRPVVLRSSFGISYEYNTIRLTETSGIERLTYVALMTVTHHLVLFLLESFNMGLILSVLKKTLFSSIFTIVLCLSFIILFSRKRS